MIHRAWCRWMSWWGLMIDKTQHESTDNLIGLTTEHWGYIYIYTYYIYTYYIYIHIYIYNIYYIYILYLKDVDYWLMVSDMSDFQGCHNATMIPKDLRTRLFSRIETTHFVHVHSWSLSMVPTFPSWLLMVKSSYSPHIWLCPKKAYP